MPNLIDDVTVKMGRMIKVWNTERKAFSNSKEFYIAIAVEGADGGDEETLLFTEKEIENARYRASRNPEDLPEKSWWTDIND